MTTLQRIEAQAKRLEKARRLVESGKVEQLTPDKAEWAVDSQRDGDKWYLVRLNGAAKCTCPDYRRRGKDIEVCKHILAVELWKGGHMDMQLNRPSDDELSALAATVEAEIQERDLNLNLSGNGGGPDPDIEIERDVRAAPLSECEHLTGRTPIGASGPCLGCGRVGCEDGWCS